MKETDITERSCENCTYYPCLRTNCGKVCNNHKFEHEILITNIEKGNKL